MDDYTAEQLKMVARAINVEISGENQDEIRYISIQIDEPQGCEYSGHKPILPALLSPNGEIAIRDWFIKEGANSIVYYMGSNKTESGWVDGWGCIVDYVDDLETEEFGHGFGKTPQEAILDCIIRYLSE